MNGAYTVSITPSNDDDRDPVSQSLASVNDLWARITEREWQWHDLDNDIESCKSNV